MSADLLAQADLGLSLRVLARAVAMEAAGEVMPPDDGSCVKCGQHGPSGCPIAAEGGLCRWDFSRRSV